MKLNFELLEHILKKIDTCPAKDGCLTGDSGDIHCILCKHNVLSTDELKGIRW